MAYYLEKVISKTNVTNSPSDFITGQLFIMRVTQTSQVSSLLMLHDLLHTIAKQNGIERYCSWSRYVQPLTLCIAPLPIKRDEMYG